MGAPAVIPEGEVIINDGCDNESGVSLNWDTQNQMAGQARELPSVFVTNQPTNRQYGPYKAWYKTLQTILRDLRAKPNLRQQLWHSAT
jgi:hypothetical protein